MLCLTQNAKDTFFVEKTIKNFQTSRGRLLPELESAGEEFEQKCWWFRIFSLLLGAIITHLMEDITDLFVHILEQSPSLDIAEAEFKQMLVDEPEWRAKYRDYCREMGYSERRGFIDFYEEHYSREESIWENLQDYDDLE